MHSGAPTTPSSASSVSSVNQVNWNTYFAPNTLLDPSIPINEQICSSTANFPLSDGVPYFSPSSSSSSSSSSRSNKISSPSSSVTTKTSATATSSRPTAFFFEGLLSCLPFSVQMPAYSPSSPRPITPSSFEFSPSSFCCSASVVQSNPFLENPPLSPTSFQTPNNIQPAPGITTPNEGGKKVTTTTTPNTPTNLRSLAVTTSTISTAASRWALTSTSPSSYAFRLTILPALLVSSSLALAHHRFHVSSTNLKARNERDEKEWDRELAFLKGGGGNGGGSGTGDEKNVGGSQEEEETEVEAEVETTTRDELEGTRRKSKEKNISEPKFELVGQERWREENQERVRGQRGYRRGHDEHRQVGEHPSTKSWDPLVAFHPPSGPESNSSGSNSKGKEQEKQNSTSASAWESTSTGRSTFSSARQGTASSPRGTWQPGRLSAISFKPSGRPQPIPKPAEARSENPFSELVETIGRAQGQEKERVVSRVARFLDDRVFELNADKKKRSNPSHVTPIQASNPSSSSHSRFYPKNHPGNHFIPSSSPYIDLQQLRVLRQVLEQHCMLNVSCIVSPLIQLFVLLSPKNLNDARLLLQASEAACLLPQSQSNAESSSTISVLTKSFPLPHPSAYAALTSALLKQDDFRSVNDILRHDLLLPPFKHWLSSPSSSTLSTLLYNKLLSQVTLRLPSSQITLTRSIFHSARIKPTQVILDFMVRGYIQNLDMEKAQEVLLELEFGKDPLGDSHTLVQLLVGLRRMDTIASDGRSNMSVMTAPFTSPDNNSVAVDGEKDDGKKGKQREISLDLDSLVQRLLTSPVIRRQTYLLNTLMAHYVDRGRTEAALGLLEYFDMEGKKKKSSFSEEEEDSEPKAQPDAATFDILIRIYTSHGDTKSANDLHLEMLRRGHAMGERMLGFFLHTFARTYGLEETTAFLTSFRKNKARSLQNREEETTIDGETSSSSGSFDGVFNISQFAYAAIFHGILKRDGLESGMKLLKQMTLDGLYPGEPILTILIRYLIQLGQRASDPRQFQQLIEDIVKKSDGRIIMTIEHVNVLLQGLYHYQTDTRYASFRNQKKKKKNDLLEPANPSPPPPLLKLSSSSDPSSNLQSYIEHLLPSTQGRTDLKPDSKTLLTIMDMYASYSEERERDENQRPHTLVEEGGGSHEQPPSAPPPSAEVLSQFIKESIVQKGLRLSHMHISTLLRTEISQGNLDTASTIIQKSQKDLGLNPIQSWFVIMMDGYNRTKQFNRTRFFFQEISKSGLIPDQYAFATLAQSYALVGDVEKTLDIVREAYLTLNGSVQNPHPVFTSIVYGAYLSNFDPIGSQIYVKKMLDEGLKPTWQLYNQVASSPRMVQRHIRFRAGFVPIEKKRTFPMDKQKAAGMGWINRERMKVMLEQDWEGKLDMIRMEWPGPPDGFEVLKIDDANVAAGKVLKWLEEEEGSSTTINNTESSSFSPSS